MSENILGVRAIRRTITGQASRLVLAKMLDGTDRQFFFYEEKARMLRDILNGPLYGLANPEGGTAERKSEAQAAADSIKDPDQDQIKLLEQEVNVNQAVATHDNDMVLVALTFSSGYLARLLLDEVAYGQLLRSLST